VPEPVEEPLEQGLVVEHLDERVARRHRHHRPVAPGVADHGRLPREPLCTEASRDPLPDRGPRDDKVNLYGVFDWNATFEVVRVTMTVRIAVASVEQLTIGFVDTTVTTLSMAWDETTAMVRLKVAARQEPPRGPSRSLPLAGAVLVEQGRHVAMAPMHGGRQRRAEVAVPMVHVGTERDETLHHGQVPFAGGPGQRGSRLGLPVTSSPAAMNRSSSAVSPRPIARSAA
jgi:hypothetical protein